MILRQFTPLLELMAQLESGRIHYVGQMSLLSQQIVYPHNPASSSQAKSLEKRRLRGLQYTIVALVVNLPGPVRRL